MPVNQTIDESQLALPHVRLHFQGMMEAAFPRLKAYLGDVRFAALADVYLAALPSRIPNASVYWNGFPAFIAGPRSPLRRAELAEFALLENALRRAQEAEPAGASGLAALHQLQPSAQLLQLKHNTLSLWSALVAGEMPPKPEPLPGPLDVLVWRQGTVARFRMIGPEEALALKRAPAAADPVFLSAWRESGLVA